MTVKAKRFRIGVEGATTDGREIQREWLEQMAASYNPAVYTALINLEHIKSYLPDSTFNRYGKGRRCLLKKSRKVRWQARWHCMPTLSQRSPWWNW